MLNIRNLIIAAWLSFLSCAPNGAANAATVATFNFTQGGWIDGTYSLTGSFTGSVDSGGYITKDTLTSFQASLEGTLPGTYFPDPITSFDNFFFSFDTFMPIDSGTLAIYSPEHGFYDLCVGAPAVFGYCGVDIGAGPNVRGRLGLFFSLQAPVVTLVSISTTDAPPPNGTPGGTNGVPEPSTLAMMILGFGALGLTLRGRRKLASAGR